MSGAKTWLIVGGVGAVGLAAGVLLFALRPATESGAGGERQDGPASTASAKTSTPAPPVPPPLRPGQPVPPLTQDPLSPSRAQPYRPAKPLSYSEGVPPLNPGDDDRSPILLRILAVTQATPEQEAKIRRAWKVHEDGRRVLLAEAHPPSIGLPVLDPQKLLELDRALDTAVMYDALTPPQRDRLLLEMGPKRVPPEEPPPEP